MDASSLGLGSTGADELFSRKPDSEPPEFDITAMVDLVFMMNIYFLVTFVAVAGGLNLPAAHHCVALDADEAVIFTMARSLDGQGVALYVGDGTKTEPINDSAQQEQRIQAALEEGAAAGKKSVLLKAEKKVRMADYFRIATAATSTGLKLHDAVLERRE